MGINTPDPIRPGRDPYKDYKVEPLQGDKKEREKFPPLEKPSGAALLAAYVLQFFRKLFSLFEDQAQENFPIGREQDIKTDLTLLRAAFDILKGQDRSQDIQFLNHLSEIWHRVQEDSFLFRRSSPFSMSLRSLIKQIQNYPPDEEHTLGYYLTEFAGQSWLPFPYMELIQKIHYEHERTPSLSILTVWTAQLNQLIKSLAG
jgi:hypothetical protein